MHRAFVILSTSMALLTGCREQSDGDPGATLSFSVVHEEAIGNGRFIDTPDFPKLGYVAATPELTMTNLDMVDLHAEPKGRASLRIKVSTADVSKLAVVTRGAVGNRMLIRVDDVMLAAPNLLTPITDGYMEITLPQRADGPELGDRLRTMTRRRR